MTIIYKVCYSFLLSPSNWKRRENPFFVALIVFAKPVPLKSANRGKVHLQVLQMGTIEIAFVSLNVHLLIWIIWDVWIQLFLGDRWRGILWPMWRSSLIHLRTQTIFLFGSLKTFSTFWFFFVGLRSLLRTNTEVIESFSEKTTRV